MPCQAAVVGTGGWSEVHLQALSESPHVDAVTLVGRNRQRLSDLADRFAIVRRTETELQRVLEEPAISLVHVVLPHHLHAPTTIAALRAGKHVICEKPGALRPADLDEAIETAKSVGRRLFITLNQLYNPVAQRVAALVRHGMLGRVFLSVENAYSNAARNYRDPHAWRTTIDRAGGGILIDGGFHMVYRHLSYLEPYGWPRWVLADAAQLNIVPSGAAVGDRGEDCVSITVGYESSLRVQWSHAWTLAANVRRNRQNFLAGTDATLELTDDPDKPLLLHHAANSSETIDVETWPQTPADTTRVCLLDYLDCLATGRQPRRARLALARQALAVITAAYESSRCGARVDLPAGDVKGTGSGSSR